MTTTRLYHNSFKPLPTRTSDLTSDGDAVRAFSILTTDTVIFEALENDRGHSSSSSFEVDGRTVRLSPTTSRPAPDWILALEPGCDLRVVAAREWIAASVESARAMIVEAYPSVAEAVAEGVAHWDGGRLVTDVATAGRIVEARS